MKCVKFIHLRIHSDFSMVDGLSKLDLLIQRAVVMNVPALALTDVNNLFGVIKFYSLTRSFNIKPIIGVDVFTKSFFLSEGIFKITILAMNNIGYKNIIKILSEIYQLGYCEDIGPIVTSEILLRYSEGIIVLSGGTQGEIGHCIFKNFSNELKKNILFYKKNFKNRFYLEISRIGEKKEELYIHNIKNISLLYNIPVVATNLSVFLKSEDYEVHKIRVAIYFRKHLSDLKSLYKYTEHQFLKSEDEICQLFQDIPESLINSVEIAKRCNVVINFEKYHLPIFSTGQFNSIDFFLKKVISGLEIRLKNIYPVLKIRMKKRRKYDIRLWHEIKIIKKMGFVSYFLIVSDFITWSKNNNIPVGPGRGSGAGSLVAFSLKITEIDPLKFDLLFERFLNPDRVSLPDFDIDFCMDKRDLVIDYVSKKYGRNAVAQIITFGTMAAKVVIRDVGRVLGYPYGFINHISKLVPLDVGITLKKAFSIQKDLSNLYKKNNDVKVLIDSCQKLEGVVRNIGKHAGGVVIAPKNISDFLPLYCDPDGSNQITQFDKNDIEYVGLVKFDFLGLKTLTVISSCIVMINKSIKNLQCNKFSINDISLSDEKCFSLLKKAETIAVFQLESSGMRNLIRRMQPDSFEDLIALVALFRPGPLQSGMVDNFINRKHGNEIIAYPDSKWQHDSLKSILDPTYGIILYQEQVMKISQVLSGYTPGEADILRRAMGKKDPEEMAKQRVIFQKGAQKNNISLKLSGKIFNLLEKFASYGFNKSHSATYALLSYQTLWLKAHYPSEFMAAALNSDISNTDKVIILINEVKRMKIKIIPPCINFSKYNFFVNKLGHLVYGLGAIKGLGKSSIEAIIENRDQNKKIFKNFLDLCVRVKSKNLTRRVFERLIMSGSFDCFGVCRFELFNDIKYTIRSSSQYLQSSMLKQPDLFSDINLLIHKNNKSIHKKEKKNNEKIISKKLLFLRWEVETLGFYFSGHPVRLFFNELKYYTKGCTIHDCIKNKKLYKNINLFGMINYYKVRVSKSNNFVYSIMLDDSFDCMEVVFFDLKKEIADKVLKKGNIVIISGTLNFDKFYHRYKLFAKKVIDLESIRRKYINYIIIKITINLFNKENFLNNLLKLLKNFSKGNTVIKFFYVYENKISEYFFNMKWKIDPKNDFLGSLIELCTIKNIKLNFLY